MPDAVAQVKEKTLGVVDKAAQILMTFTFDEPELDLREIARRVEINKSTACRILKQLAAYHFIEQHPNTGLYRLGIRLFELGSLAADNLKLGEAARPYLEKLTEETGEASHFAILDGSYIVHLLRVESPNAIRAVPCRLGERYLFHSLAIGKAIVAFLPAAETASLISANRLSRFTENTITKRATFERELQKIRGLGYALDNEEFIKGIKCIAAPVRGYKGQVLGGINITGPAVSLSRERIAKLAPLVILAANKISHYLSKDSARYVRVA